jgi:hypothetical protein
MRIIVCGGRDYDNKTVLCDVLDAVHNKYSISCIIEGAARGADRLAGAWALMNGISREEYPANWKYYGKRAGYLRNITMSHKNPDMIIAFPGGKGTKIMIEIGMKKDIPTYVVDEGKKSLRRISTRILLEGINHPRISMPLWVDEIFPIRLCWTDSTYSNKEWRLMNV